MKQRTDSDRHGFLKKLLLNLFLTGFFTVLNTIATAQVGTPWAWGDNAYSQLGDGTTTQRTTPLALSTFSKNIVSLVGGRSHGLALTSAGTVLSWGNNAYGQLGDGTNTSRNQPTSVSGLANIVQVAVGATLFGDRIYFNYNGSGKYQIYSMNPDGTDIRQLLFDNSDKWQPVLSPLGNKIVYTCNKSGINEIYTCDLNGSNVRQITTSSTDASREAIWSPDGKQLAVSDGLSTSLVNADGSNFRPFTTEASHSRITGWSPDGKWLVGITDKNDAAIALWNIDGSDPKFLYWYATSGCHTAGPRFSPDGKSIGFHGYIEGHEWEVWSISPDGLNATQITNNSQEDNFGAWSPDGSRIVFVSSRDHGHADGDGTDLYVMNIDGSNQTRLTFFKDRLRCWPSSWGKNIASNNGYAHSLALAKDGTLWAWGDNSFGQLGTGDNIGRSTPTVLLTNVAQVCAGGGFSVALKTDGTVWAWGINTNGQLGNGQTQNQNLPVQVKKLSDVVQVTVGSGHALALKADGTVWAWGNNSSGQLGEGTTSDQLTPVAITALSDVTQVSAGDSFSVVITSDGRVWTWGANEHGQLGDGTNNNSLVPTALWDMPSVSQVSVGSSHVLALSTEGTVWAWGNNSTGQLGDGTTNDNSHPAQVQGILGQTYVAAGANFSMALNAVVRRSTTTATPIKKPYGTKIALSGALTNKGMLSLQQPIHFFLDGTYLGFDFTNASGQVQFPPTTTVSVGTHTLTTVFLGTSLWSMSGGNAKIVISKSDTKVTVNSAKAMIGQTVSLVFKITRNSDGAGVANASLMVKLQGSLLGSVLTDMEGKATLTYTITESNTLGASPLKVEFSGDKNYNPSSGDGILTVTQSKTKLHTVSRSGNQGQRVLLTAILRRSSDNATLQGKTVRFSLEGNAVGSAVTDSTGTATLLYTIPSTLAKGTYSLTSFFDGDTWYLSCAGDTAQLIVK